MHEANKEQLTLIAEQWLATNSTQYVHLNHELLQQACQFAINLSGDQPVPFASSALEQGLAITEELLALHCDNLTLATAIIYPMVYHHQINSELVTLNFNPIVLKLITGVKRMALIHDLPEHAAKPSNPQQQIDNLRKMLLTMVDDVRVVLIKLAEQLAILKYLRNALPEQRQIIAQQTATLYAPLANRLGIGQIKWQMEDLVFRFLHTDIYRDISQQLKMRRADRETYVADFIQTLSVLLQQHEVTDFDISGRAKHIYSIYRKIIKKQVDFSQIYDTTAVRVLVPTIKDCYSVLSIAHQQWPHINAEFDDYIAKPKPNGYRSIHTVVIGPQALNIEIQIRTHKMHQEAELGVAAHWKYKEGGGVQSSFEDKINWLRSLLDWQKEISDPEQDSLLEQLFADRIYVFTPRGDIYDLAQGATPLDFAYHIHSDIGNRCRGAKVNDKLIPLTHTLKTGDKVDILTANNHHPSRDWMNPQLGYLTTTRARQKVRNWFRKADQEQHYQAGTNLWEKAYRREHLNKNVLADAATHFNLQSSRDLLIALGAGDLNIASVIKYLKPTETTKSLPPPHIPLIKTVHSPAPKVNRGFVIEGVDNLLTQLARCCRPIPGDAIVGYITQGRGINIHQKNCRNIQYSLKHHPARVIAVSWGSENNHSSVSLSIEADDREGLIRDITGVIANNKISLLSFNSRADSLQSRAYIQLVIEINHTTALATVQNQLRQIQSVVEVKRL